MRRRVLILGWILLAPLCARAETLTLVSAQEGDPQAPRALILIHAAPGSRADFTELLEGWSKSWALRQYASIYLYEYTSGLSTMPSLKLLSERLAERVEAGSFQEVGGVTTGLDARQPPPALGTQGGGSGTPLQLVLVGHGVGGLISASAGTTLNQLGFGLRSANYGSRTFNYLQFLLLVAQQETASALGVPQSTRSVLESLSTGWCEVAAVPAGTGAMDQQGTPPEPTGTPCYGVQTQAPPRLPFDNVLYGPGTKVTDTRRAATDRVVEVPETPDPAAGSIKDRWNKDLLVDDAAYTFLIQKVAEPDVWSGYLERRAKVEAYFASTGASQIGSYFDDRDGLDKPAYAPPEQLYFYMWLSPLPGEES